MFDEMISRLEDIITNIKLFPGMRATAIRACAVLCKYYSKMDDSYMYQMAMSKILFSIVRFCINLISLSDASFIQN